MIYNQKQLLRYSIGFLVVISISMWIFSINKRGKVNMELTKKLVSGMSNVDVIKVMGRPKDSISNFTFKKIYRYEAPLGSSDDIQIFFDSTDRLVRLNKGQ